MSYEDVNWWNMFQHFLERIIMFSSEIPDDKLYCPCKHLHQSENHDKQKSTLVATHSYEGLLQMTLSPYAFCGVCVCVYRQLNKWVGTVALYAARPIKFKDRNYCNCCININILCFYCFVHVTKCPFYIFFPGMSSIQPNTVWWIKNQTLATLSYFHGLCFPPSIT